jgi:hypothetical protein
MGGLAGLVRPPFANYDIVVYFGGGLFFLPFLFRYFLEPFAVPIPLFILNESGQVTLEVIRGLSIIILVYIAGHLVAYFASQLVEKTVDRFLGKISTSILVSIGSAPAQRDGELRRIFRKRTKKIAEEKAVIASTIRAIFHVPNFPHYLLIYVLGFFGYLDSRIPKEAFDKAKSVYSKKVDSGQVAEDTKWYKSLEYYVMNNIPDAVPRMYNYLIIAGLFRSLAFTFLWSAGMILLYIALYWAHGVALVGPVGGRSSLELMLAEWFALSSLSVSCITLYLKFQRRYAEEAIMALAFHP